MTFTTHRAIDNAIQLTGTMADMRCGAAGLQRGEYYVHSGLAVVGAFRITHRAIEEIDASAFVLQHDEALEIRAASHLIPQVICTTVNTHELRNGDVLVHHGAMFRLRDRQEWASHDCASKAHAPVITFETDLLNDGGDIPRGWRMRNGVHHWVVQGNSLATWAKVVSEVPS